MAITLKINGETKKLDVDPETPLLWVLRDALGMTGTKFGCGIGVCGACTVHVNGAAERSCSVTVSAVAGKSVLTIEGLSKNRSHAVQRAWIAEDVPQCGYCQSGMIMAVAAMLKEVPKPTDDDINSYITNICRCGTYSRIRKAIKRAAGA
jgi:isoquinoline 1-oxidoreductase subunit alpha